MLMPIDENLHNFRVTGNYGTHVTAVRTIDVTYADEWLLLPSPARPQ